MSEERGKIEKPSVAEFKKGRKIYFVPVIYGGKGLPSDYLEKLDEYWRQVEDQINNLELKLGRANKIFHELIPRSAEEGLKALKELNERSYWLVESQIQKGCQMEATEDAEMLTEFLDWSRCLSIGLQNQKVLTKVYEAYIEAGKKRNEFISKHIDETLKEDEVGMVLMKERHQVQFPSDIEVFYISPPALDEINRWLRDWESHPSSEEQTQN